MYPEELLPPPGSGWSRHLFSPFGGRLRLDL